MRPMARVGASPRTRPAELRVFPEAGYCLMTHDVRMRRTVLVVDDHAGFRASVRELFSAGPFDVVAEAGDAPSALREFARLRPDVVLLDIALPGADGFDVAEALAAEPRPPAVVLVSTRDAADYGPRLGRAKVRGFIQKQSLSVPSLEALVT